MSTNEPGRRAEHAVSIGAAPAVGLGIGVAMLVAAVIGGAPGLGIVLFGIMAVFSLGLFVVSSRSETVRGLLDHRDERITMIDVHASALAGVVVSAAIIVAFLVQIAQGHDGSPYSWLGAIGGVSYVAAVAVLRSRT
jgi:uncharacterized membrane protein